jgi:hypothetical protein
MDRCSTVSSEPAAYAEPVAFASEIGAFASEIGAFASEIGAFASEIGPDFSPDIPGLGV